MTDPKRRPPPAPVMLFGFIPLLDRDAKRVPLIGRAIGAAGRSAGALLALRHEATAAALSGDLEEAKQIGDRFGKRVASELEEVQRVIKEWPEREPRPAKTKGKRT